METNNLIATVIGASFGIYLGAVVWNNNVNTLGAMLIKEGGYLEFLIAIALLMVIHTYLPGNPVTDLITAIAVVAVLIKAAGNTNISTALTNFSNGQATMLQTVEAILGFNISTV